MPNNLNQTPLFKACEGGHLGIVEQLLKADPSKLLDKSSDGRTCLHVVVSRGDTVLLNHLLTFIEKNLEHEKGNLLKEMDRQGNTVLHLAVRRNRLDMVTRLLQFEPDLPCSPNRENETAICVAAKLGFLPLVQELVNCSPESIGIANRNGKNILHLAVELSQVKTLKFLVEKVDLSQLINQPDEAPEEDVSQGQEDWNGSDTPLHIAARNKNAYAVELLLKVSGVNKDAVNSAGLTPLDIARDNTEYHESYKIIQNLSSYPPRGRPFLYSAPTTSPQKRKRAEELLDKIFDDRRNVELVVGVLLATMTFTAVFTVPGGFSTQPSHKGPSVLGMPMLIGYHSFKLFLVFDYVAFFLALFVVLMWEMSTPLTARDKMLFIYMTNVVLCRAFAFTAFGLMAAVYAVILLGSSFFIAVCGCGTFVYMAAKFTVRRARFHSLCGVPRRLDNIVEKYWVMAEKKGVLDVGRRGDDFFHGLVSGNNKVSGEQRPTSRKGVGECSRGDKSLSGCLSASSRTYARV